jgi:hypothetical protein
MYEQTPISEAALRALNPLWIISLFLGLAQVTVGIAATQATDGYRACWPFLR